MGFRPHLLNIKKYQRKLVHIKKSRNLLEKNIKLQLLHNWGLEFKFGLLNWESEADIVTFSYLFLF